jgi:hypothetical protein
MGQARTLTVSLDARPLATISVETGRRRYAIGPMTLAPGEHRLTLDADGPALRPADVDTSRDRRLLAIAFHDERWRVE